MEILYLSVYKLFTFVEFDQNSIPSCSKSLIMINSCDLSIIMANQALYKILTFYLNQL